MIKYPWDQLGRWALVKFCQIRWIVDDGAGLKILHISWNIRIMCKSFWIDWNQPIKSKVEE